MRRKEGGIPTLSWCLAVRNCEATIEATLKSLRERTPNAEIVIVDNMSRDRTVEIAKEYADVFYRYRGPKDVWTEDDPWTYDMASARQKSFDLASGRWRAWVDSDDRIPGPEEATRLLQLNARYKPATMAKVEDKDGQEISLEDFLRKLEVMYPDADCVWAPYLYAKDEHGQAYIWQERERIIKWSDPPKWRWAEAAHEILVPIEGYKPKMRVTLAHLLYIHERQFNEQNYRFSICRHFDVLNRQYEAGERTTRRCLYLASYAKELCPLREREFIEAAHKAATTATDRYKALVALGQMYDRQGLYLDAKEAFGAAVLLRSDLPDAWLLGGEIWNKLEDYIHAIRWIEEGLKCDPGDPDSYVNPRHHAIRYPTLLSDIYQKTAEVQKRFGFHVEAKTLLDQATKLAGEVRAHPSIGQDRDEASVRLAKVDNARGAQEHALAIRKLADYLIANDEPKKAMELLDLVPWNVQDHPIMVELERKFRPLRRHLSDPEAYLEFYSRDIETGAVASPDTWLDPKTCINRVRWLASWLNAYNPTAKVLDVGCFDGIVGIPLLQLAPNITYVGVDVHADNIERFQKRLDARGLGKRAKLHALKDIRYLAAAQPDVLFDVAVWFEVIEHVPDPRAEMKNIVEYLRPGGQLFVTTPWGSFDAGHPPEKTDHGRPRDMRGHVRAMTPRDVVSVFDDVGVQVESLEKEGGGPEQTSAGMGVYGTYTPKLSKRIPASFVVPSALWDWNGRTLKLEGMGASEKAIVQVGEALSVDYRRVEVFGPVPCEDVSAGVRYWPLSQLRHLRDGKVIVSRHPTYAAKVDEAAQEKLRKILWLQDAWYGDLNKKTAEDFEKIVVVSEWHKLAMHEQHGVPLSKMEVIYNPVDPLLYVDHEGWQKRKRDHFVYCSSPDRGLLPLLRLWPKILERLPGATLDVFYGMKGCEKLGQANDAHWTQRYEAMRREFEILRHQKGIAIYGMVAPQALARAFQRAGVWFYPLTDFRETCCTSALEARAGGCVPVCPPLAALSETGRCKQGFLIPTADQPDFEEKALAAVVSATQVSDQERVNMSLDVLLEFSIEAMLPRWKALLDG